MICRNCGTEIAANALICYKCGTATTEPRIPPPSAARRRSPGRVMVLIVLAVAVTLIVRMTACGSLL
ncbi:MAG: zinc ribbon domain-containing protein [Vicinamibacterales bacterium]